MSSSKPSFGPSPSFGHFLSLDFEFQNQLLGMSDSSLLVNALDDDDECLYSTENSSLVEDIIEPFAVIPSEDETLEQLISIPFPALEMEGENEAWRSNATSSSSSSNSRDETSRESINVSSKASKKPTNSNGPHRKKQICTAVKKHRIKKKDLMIRLRKRVLELQEEFKQLQIAHGIDDCGVLVPSKSSSQWEIIAKKERHKVQLSLQENSHLKLSLNEQIKFNRSLKRMLQRKSTYHELNMSITSHWKLNHLVRDTTARIKGIHAIASRQFDLLSTVLIQTGLYGLEEEFASDKLTVDNGRIMIGEIIRNNRYRGVDMCDLAETCWLAMVTHFTYSTKFLHCEQSFERIDKDTMYVYLKHYYGRMGIACEGGYVWKRFYVNGEIIMIWKFIDYDERYPNANVSGDFRDEGWIVVGQNRDGIAWKKAVLKFDFDNNSINLPEACSRKWINIMGQYFTDCEAFTVAMARNKKDRFVQSHISSLQEDCAGRFANLMLAGDG